jgi:hypothetical protein
MRHLLTANALALAMLLVATVAQAAPYSGMQVAGTITTSVNTANAYVGEPVTVTNVQSENGSIHGARMYGYVSSVVKAGQGRPAQVQMRFTRLVLSNGTSYAVNGVVTGMQAQTKNNALKEAGGALAGMLIGNAIGKTIFHMSGGGFLGAAGGFLVAKNNRENMVVPAGSTVRVTIRSVRRQPTH